jgi:tetratricopeptide (TPR) repeat protein
MRHLLLAGLFLVLASGLAPPTSARGQTVGPSGGAGSTDTSLETAEHLFFAGRFDDAAELALQIRAGAPDDLASYELRTSALHFQIKRALGDAKDRDDALKACAECAAWLSEMRDDTERGQQIARRRIKSNPDDIAALFFLGKIDLNHIWLYLGTLGRKTGWNEYWEARHSLDAVLKLQPDHVRARVARAWIDYIVDTRVPWGIRWVLGGGNKKRALGVIRDAAAADSDFYSKAEARFALWEMLVREDHGTEAAEVARTLARDFPNNREIARFLDTHASQAVQ